MLKSKWRRTKHLGQTKVVFLEKNNKIHAVRGRKNGPSGMKGKHKQTNPNPGIHQTHLKFLLDDEMVFYI